MSYFRRKLERRTFSQDRYYILIKRQKEGTATFNELTELDEIVNRVPDIRQLVIKENFGEDEGANNDPMSEPVNRDRIPIRPGISQNFWTRIKNWINRNLSIQISAGDQKDLAALF